MKKEKKIKLFVKESTFSATKKLLNDNKIEWWNTTTHFQFDWATAVVTLVSVIVVIVLIAAL
jgi:hypothetical protein